MLNIQEELKSGKSLEEVCTTIGIDFKEKDGKVLFNYDMVESYKHKANPIVQESRGLILYKDSWYVAAYPFKRFLNYGETGAAKLPENLEGCYVLEKLDGSMLSLRWDKVNNKWEVSTRGMLYAEGQVNDLTTMTFADLFWEGANQTKIPYILEQGLINKDLTYVFELTSIHNRIVTRYTETTITLLTVRDNVTHREYSRMEVNRIANDLGCPVVKSVKLTNWEQLLKMDVDPLFEGYVVVRENKTGSHDRVKVKNPSYLAISRLTSSHSERAFMELVQRGDHAEFLTYFPEYTANIQKLLDGIDKIEHTAKKLIAEYESSFNGLDGLLGDSKDHNGEYIEYSDAQLKSFRARFAAFATKCAFPTIMFLWYDGKISLNHMHNALLAFRADTLLDMIRRVNHE